MAKLAAFETWKAPWENSGEEFDAEKARKFIYDLHVKVEARDETLKIEKTKARDAETASADMKTQLDAKVTTENSDVDKLTRELAAANGKLAAVDKAAADSRSLALDVALDIEGITAKQAKALAPLLRGTTEDELSEAATAVIEALGIKIGNSSKDDSDGENTDTDSLRRRGQVPRSKGDPNRGDDGRTLPDKITFDVLNELVPL